MPRQAAYREAHPLPFVILHWTHLVSLLALAATGLFIHQPFLLLRMGVVRQVHFTAAYALTLTALCRVWFALFGRSTVLRGTRRQERDILNFLPQAANRGTLVATVRYYLFMRPGHPSGAKYNPLQKSAYVAIGVLVAAQAVTGFLLYAPLFGGALPAVAWGGPMAVRSAHYLITWLFAAITVVHVYLSLTEDPAAVPLMLAWRETPEAPTEDEEAAWRLSA